MTLISRSSTLLPGGVLGLVSLSGVLDQRGPSKVYRWLGVAWYISRILCPMRYRSTGQVYCPLHSLFPFNLQSSLSPKYCCKLRDEATSCRLPKFRLQSNGCGVCACYRIQLSYTERNLILNRGPSSQQPPKLNYLACCYERASLIS